MATNKTRIKIRHGNTTPAMGTDGLLPYELGWDNNHLVLYINNNGAIRLINSENALGRPLASGDNVDTLDPGIYYSSSSPVSETLNGTKPNGDASGFRLEVIRGYGTNYGALIAYDNSSLIKIRKNAGSNDFTDIPWRSIIASPSNINLLIDKVSPSIYLRNPDIDTTAATLSSIKYNTIYFCDVDYRYNAYVQAGQNTNGSTFIAIGSRRRNTDNDANVNNTITLRSYADETVAVVVSHPAAWCEGIGAVNKVGDTMTGTLNRYYTATSTEPMITLRSYNADVLLFLIGHASLVAGTFSNHYKLAYKGTGTSPNNYLQLIANDNSTDTIAMLVNESGNVSFTNTVNANISGNAAKDSDGNVINTTYLKLSGGTLTGNLIINKSSSPWFELRSGAMDNMATSLTAATYSTIYFCDLNDKTTAYVQCGQDTSGTSLLTLAARHRDSNGNNLTNYLILKQNATSGSMVVSVSSPAAWRSALATIHKAGDTMTGDLTVSTASLPGVIAQDTTNNNLSVKLLVGSGHLNHGIYSVGYAPTASTYTSSGKWIIYRGSDGEAHTGLKLYGAVWNDYAEYRNTLEDSKPGQCVIENGDDSLRLSTSRMQRAAHIVSDTFGFAIGKTDKCKTPVAVSGRVLAYIYEGRGAAREAIGCPVCSGPNGTVSIMTDEEYKNFGYCAIGTISAVPDYEKWGEKGEEVDVNGRIWIKVY